MRRTPELIAVNDKYLGVDMNLDLSNLALFIRVAALGAVGKAGEEFGYSSTNSSQRIQSLERELGVKLFHRTTRAVTLTQDGQLFVEHAKRILDDIEETINVFTGEPGKVQGKLKITASASFGRFYIVPFIPEFLRLHPGLQIEIDFSDSIVDIVEQGYDVAFRQGELAPSSLLAQKIDDNPRVLVASPEYLQQYGEPKNPYDLIDHTCIPFGKANHWKFKDENKKLHEVAVNGPISVNWGDAVSDFVEAGIGIGLASMWHAGPAIKSGRIIRVLPEYKIWPPTKLWAVRSPGRLTPARVKVFLDFIAIRIKKTNQERYGSLLSIEI